jgi:hypothetical protein
VGSQRRSRGRNPRFLDSSGAILSPPDIGRRISYPDSKVTCVGFTVRVAMPRIHPPESHGASIAWHAKRSTLGVGSRNSARNFLVSPAGTSGGSGFRFTENPTENDFVTTGFRHVPGGRLFGRDAMRCGGRLLSQSILHSKRIDWVDGGLLV